MLEIRGITGGYGDTIVLRDVNLTVPDGKVVALLGPNGAGKTTLLRMASGLLRPTSGAVVLDGREVTRDRPCRRMRLGVCHIPEGRGIFPSLTVHDNLVMHSPKGREAESFERAVEAFPLLGERRRQLAGTLSGGEQQMLAIVRAYVTDPAIVLVDEASLGLAPVVVEGIFGFLERLAERGASLLIVEQYVHLVLALADHVYVLNRGRVTFDGEPSDLHGDAVFESYITAERPPSQRGPLTAG